MGRSIDGILLIDKEGGETSHAIVKRVRSAFVGWDVKKVGHAGTLDPFATGLLIILIGQGTKLFPFIMSGSKVYQATIRLGIETDTMDPTGNVVSTCSVPVLTREQIQDKARSLEGEKEQTPPAYSAVRFGGKRAYKLARKGVKFDLESRKIMVHSLSILSVDLPHVTIEVRCSSGTYVRSLAAELGRSLGLGAHIKSLRRLASGPFEVENALGSKEISQQAGGPLIRDRIIPLRAALPNMMELEVGKDIAERVRQGHQPTWEELKEVSALAAPKGNGDGRLKLVTEGDLLAILRIDRGNGASHSMPRLERVFL
jgi:tRNA pseudouridine55 synthase